MLPSIIVPSAPLKISTPWESLPDIRLPHSLTPSAPETSIPALLLPRSPVPRTLVPMRFSSITCFPPGHCSTIPLPWNRLITNPRTQLSAPVIFRPSALIPALVPSSWMR